MAWQTPKTNWGQPGQTVPGATDFNRIEGNIQELQNTKETPAGAQAKVDTHANVNASTSAKGHVQLTDSVSSTSTTTAATPNSVKQAYDKANAAMPKSGGTFTGQVTAQNNANYTTSQIRNIILYQDGTTIPTLANGEIAIIYES